MKPLTPKSIFIIGPLFVIFLWLFTMLWPCGRFSTDTLEPLFTGLGFVAILATLVHERGQVAERDNEHRELLHKMQVQIKATCHAARIAALTASIANDRAELDKFHLSGVSLASGSGLMATKRREEIERRLRASGESLRKAAEISEFL